MDNQKISEVIITSLFLGILFSIFFWIKIGGFSKKIEGLPSFEVLFNQQRQKEEALSDYLECKKDDLSKKNDKLVCNKN